MHQGNIFLLHLPLLHRPAQGSGGLFAAGVYHAAAHVFVQPMNGEHFAPQGAYNGGGDFLLGIQPHRLEDNGNILV